MCCLFRWTLHLVVISCCSNFCVFIFDATPRVGVVVGKGGRFGMRSRVEMGKGRSLRYEQGTYLFGRFVKVLLEKKTRDDLMLLSCTLLRAFFTESLIAEINFSSPSWKVPESKKISSKCHVSSSSTGEVGFCCESVKLKWADLETHILVQARVWVCLLVKKAGEKSVPQTEPWSKARRPRKPKNRLPLDQKREISEKSERIKMLS